MSPVSQARLIPQGFILRQGIGARGRYKGILRISCKMYYRQQFTPCMFPSFCYSIVIGFEAVYRN